MNTVFIYGTLKQGHGNHFMLGDSEFIGNAVTEENYLLLEQGLPFLIKDTQHEYSRLIHGELYSITDKKLSELDDLEGHPYFYKRELAWVSMNDSVYHTWVYFLTDECYNDCKDDFEINKKGIY